MSAAWNACEERDRSDFVELNNMPRVYVSGVAYVEQIDGLLHIVYFVKHPSAQGLEKVLELELVMPAAEVPVARVMVNTAMGKAVRLLNG